MAGVGVLSAATAQGCQFASSSFRIDSGASSSSDDSQKHLSLGSRNQACFSGGKLRRPQSRGSPATPRGSTAVSAALGNLTADVQEDDVTKGLEDDKEGADDDENIVSSTCTFLETINAVVADVVDGQKFLKETGRTKPRPMKRRSLMACLAMGAIQPFIKDMEDTIGTLRRTTSTSFARTCQLVSQISFGASARAASFLAEQQRDNETERLMPAAA